MSRQTPRRRGLTAVAVVAGVTAIALGAWGLSAWAPFEHGEPGADVFWPRNIAPLAGFVEDETGLQFLQPLDVEYIADGEAFRARARPAPEPTEERRATADTDAAVGRALGFWSGDVHPLDDAATLREASDVGAALLVDEGVLVVRATDGEADLGTLDRTQLVFLLTEAIDDQHFHLARRLRESATAQEFQALAGLDAGEAIRVRDAYVSTFGFDEFDVYTSDTTERAAEFDEAVAGMAPAYRALQVVAQNLGPAFVASLHEGERGAVEAAFGDDNPTALDQLSLPTSKYVRRDATEAVSAPPVPRDATAIYQRQMGPFGVYLLLAQAADAPTALTAGDGWGNDAFSAYLLDGRVCVDARIVADSRADADRIEPLLGAWAAARPEAADALVGRDGTTLVLSVCDPGTEAEQAIVSQDAVDQYFGRAKMLSERVRFSGKPALAECETVTIFAEHDYFEISSTPELMFPGESDAVTDGCLGSI